MISHEIGRAIFQSGSLVPVYCQEKTKEKKNKIVAQPFQRACVPFASFQLE
jgi:hypothetical protein